MSEDAPTLGEVVRLQKDTREDIAELRKEVQDRPDWKDVQRVELGLQKDIRTGLEASEARDKIQDLAIAKLEGWGNWATKLAGGAVIAAVLVSAGIGK